MLTKRYRVYRLAEQSAQAREGFAVAPGPCPSGSPPLLMAAARAGLVSQRGSDMSRWRFKTAAHSSKMLTKRHRLYRLARQLAQAREGFTVAPGPCPSGSPLLLMAAARTGLVSQCGSEMSRWRFETADTTFETGPGPHPGHHRHVACSGCCAPRASRPRPWPRVRPSR